MTLLNLQGLGEQILSYKKQNPKNLAGLPNTQTLK
jgi:hypothetical protein